MRNNFKELNKRLDERELEIERLNNIINNPEDLTLCKMWADTKLIEKNEELMSLYTSERYVKEDYKSIINKAIEYIEDENIDITTIRFNDIQDVKKDLLEILKGEESKEKHNDFNN